MEKLGRNEPCHCGSGKKYKNCHEQKSVKKESRKKVVLLGSIIGLLIIAAIIIAFSSSKPSKNEAPSGPAPQGKIWNEEHGHWHDI